MILNYMPQLIITHTSCLGKSWIWWLNEHTLFIGRGHKEGEKQYLDLSSYVNDEAVSRRHCMIKYIGPRAGFEARPWSAMYETGIYERSLEDVGSHRLRNGDILRLPNNPPDHGNYFRITYRLAQETVRDPLHINILGRHACVFGRKVRLTSIEYDLLMYMCENSDRYCTIEELVKATDKWRADGYSSLHVHMSNLRKKLKSANGKFSFIGHKKGAGYRIYL
jgi:hypothetical protein